MSDKPALTRFPATTVAGLEVRTTNAAEADPKTAKIGALWHRFFKSNVAAEIQDRAHPTRVLGVYTRYESDHRGPYTLVVGCPVKEVRPQQGLVMVEIPAAEYLVFTAKGAMPQALIETWGVIRRYFDGGTARPRAYTTDFELHDLATPGEVLVHIALA